MHFNIPSLDQDNIYINNGHYLQYFIKQNDYIIKLENEIEEAFKEHMIECNECEEYDYKIYQDMIYIY